MAVEEHARHGRSNAGGHTLGMGNLARWLAGLYVCWSAHGPAGISPPPDNRTYGMSYNSDILPFSTSNTLAPARLPPRASRPSSSRTSHVVVSRVHLNILKYTTPVSLAGRRYVHTSLVFLILQVPQHHHTTRASAHLGWSPTGHDTPTLRHAALSEPLAWLPDPSPSPAPSYEINRPTRGNSIHTNFAIPSGHSLCSWTRCNLIKLPSTIIRDERPPCRSLCSRTPFRHIKLPSTIIGADPAPALARSRDDDPYILCDPVDSLRVWTRSALVNLPSAIIANAIARSREIDPYRLCHALRARMRDLASSSSPAPSYLTRTFAAFSACSRDADPYIHCDSGVRNRGTFSAIRSWLAKETKDCGDRGIDNGGSVIPNCITQGHTAIRDLELVKALI
ncbi:hypothetical protein DFP72DRAFT_846521 [Ephemerocybe angulata]|uniref:Uncharacterized protein n=1 Tax=Ephemerocybe angulata TaxID=980116 RepID=A0A8H6MA48_9AGAR|nr:hypothetical protein DFP72DRAFT_846521 [Tulosesus angulatus]